MQNDHKVNWKWKPKRWWIALVIFWLVSTTWAGIIARTGGSESMENSAIILTMLIFAIGCTCADRSWSIIKRVFWVIGLWIMHAILIIPAIFVAGIISTKPHLFERMVSLLAAIPLVIWTMRRSKFFVEPREENE